MAGLIQNPTLIKNLKDNIYKEKALIPASGWLQSEYIHKPSISVDKNNETVNLNWSTKNLSVVNKWVLYKRYGDIWEMEILKANKKSLDIITIKNGKKLNAVAIRAIDRLGNESEYDAKSI